MPNLLECCALYAVEACCTIPSCKDVVPPSCAGVCDFAAADGIPASPGGVSPAEHIAHDCHHIRLLFENKCCPQQEAKKLAM